MSYFFRQRISPAEFCIMPTLVPFASIFLIVSKSIAIGYSLLRADIDGSDGAGRAGELPLLSGNVIRCQNRSVVNISAMVFVKSEHRRKHTICFCFIFSMLYGKATSTLFNFCSG